ncbi:MAG: hypothetical protein NTW56_02205 [Alphaproteobacteria bacterium]|nr:hypothetical protein [Alphaproteobacteria bacterium]
MTDFHTEPGPLLIPRKAAFAMLGVGTTKGHELINAGLLDARKLGEKTVITMASVRALADGLPRIGRASASERRTAA